MKSNKNGFTLIEIITCIVILMIIASIFAINFIGDLNRTNSREYEEAVKKIEVAADAYVMTYKDSTDSNFEDIRFVITNEDTFCYIPVEEIIDKGFLNDEFTNPITGEYFDGVVKFTKETDDSYEFEYLEDAKGYITIVYDKNGADTVTRSAQAFICEDTSSKQKVAECVLDTTLPSITRRNGNALGWSTNRDATSTTYYASTSLARLLREANYEIKNNRIILYAISTLERIAILEKNEAENIGADRVKCTLHNYETSCKVTLPDFTAPYHFKIIGWNTNLNGTGDNHQVGDDMVLTNDLTLYATTDLEEFEILVNRLNRVSSTTVTPSNINIILVLDTSGSMQSNNRLNNLKKVCLGLIDRMNLGNSTVSLIEFASSASIKLEYAHDKTTIKNKINSLSASGGTSYTAAIKTAETLIKNKPNNKETYLIFVSDGIASISASNSSLVNVKKEANIYTMGINSASDNQYLKLIASEEKNYYTYNDSLDDMSLSNFYSLFDDIVQNIIILNGDGLENAIKMPVKSGKIDFGSLILSNNYPVEIYLNEERIDIFTEVNEYFYANDKKYYFDVYDYAINKSSVGIDNMKDLRIKFFHMMDSEE